MTNTPRIDAASAAVPLGRDVTSDVGRVESLPGASADGAEANSTRPSSSPADAAVATWRQLLGRYFEVNRAR